MFLIKMTTDFFFLCTITTDAGVFVLRSAPADRLHLWSENTWMQLDVGLDHLLCWGHGSGKCGYVFSVINIPF